ncbi:MAG: hypothetical protein QXE14_00125 [Candidatus Bathyarchaeia archaeon]
MRLRALSLTMVVLIIVLASAAVQVALALPAASELRLENKARAMINVAAKAETRVKALVEMIEGNESIMEAIEGAGLFESYNEMKLLIDRGSDLLKEAHDSFGARDYAGAIQKAADAMRLFREAYTGIHRILCESGLTPFSEAPELKAQGLLVAANRSLERIMRIRSLPNASEVEDLLVEAEDLLNGIASLLDQGNVSAAAHNLAEANKLIAEAFIRLRNRAERTIRVRAEGFLLKFERIREEFARRIREEVARRIREEGLNEMEILEGLSLGNLSQTIQSLLEIVRETELERIKDVIRDIVEDLREIGKIIRSVKEIAAEKFLRMVKVGDILANASALEGKIVIVRGMYCGQDPPEGIPGPSGEPPKKNWWIISDETGWIYVVGESLIRVMYRPLANRGVGVTVVGRVFLEEDTPYIKAMMVAPSPTPLATPSDVLRLTIKVDVDGRDCLIKVTVENIGDETIVFPNAAYGAIVERKVAGFWIVIYEPISAQALVEMEPGESRTITLQLKRPIIQLAHGTYRVTVRGWLKESKMPVVASAEFTIP